MNSIFSRRTLLKTTGAGLVLTGLSGCFSNSSTTAEQEQPGPLKEMILGNKDAKIKVIEYASMTCPHCASFHNTTYKQLKDKYIDSGQIQFAFREFPLDQVAATVSVLARCAPEEKFFDVLDVFFKTQPAWRSGNNPLPGIIEIAKQVGFTQQSIEECLQNKEIIDGINAIRQHGAEVMKVQATPTFFINGKKVEGSISIDRFDEEFSSYL